MASEKETPGPGSDEREDVPNDEHDSEDVNGQSENEATKGDSSKKAADGDMRVLHIFKYNKDTKEARASASPLIPKRLEQLALIKLRWYLISEEKLGREYGNTKFCTNTGSQVDDKMVLDEYMALNEEKKGAQYSIYLRDKRRKALPDEQKKFLENKVKLEPTKQVATPEAPQLNSLSSSYSHSDWKATTSSAKVVYPADMSEKHWGIVMRNNNILCGQLPRQKTASATEDTETVGYQRVYYPAFALKPRQVPQYDMTFDMDNTQTGKDPALEQPKFRIPRFYLTDKTSVSVFETQGKHETSMAESGFTQTAIDASGGYSGIGISAAVKGGASWGETHGNASASLNETKYLHIAYNYPRVELNLDENQLELSQECKEDITKLQTERTVAGLGRFLSKYGETFTPHVYLGGRLFSTDQSDSVAGSSVEEKTSSLKAAASASLSGWGFQAEVNFTHEEGSAEKKTKKDVSLKHSITWCAEGGDTTLCNNPPAWCPTVASFYNWRIMKQTELVDLIELIGKIEGYSNIPFLRQSILSLQSKPEDCIRFGLSVSGLDLAKDPKEEDSTDGADSMKRHYLVPSAEDELENSIDPESQPKAIKSASVALIMARTESEGRDFEIAIQKGDDFAWETSKNAKSRLVESTHPRFKYGVKYLVHFRLPISKKETATYSLQRAEQDEGYSLLYGTRETASNVMIEFRRLHDKSDITGYVANDDEVYIEFSWPQEPGGSLSSRLSDIKVPYMTTHESANNITAQISYNNSANEENTIAKHLREIVRAEQIIKQAKLDAERLKREEEKKKLAEQEQSAEDKEKKEAADEAYRNGLKALIPQIFPSWESYKARMLRTAKLADDESMKQQVLNLDQKMIALVELTHSLRSGDITGDDFITAANKLQIPKQYQKSAAKYAYQGMFGGTFSFMAEAMADTLVKS